MVKRTSNHALNATAHEMSPETLVHEMDPGEILVLDLRLKVIHLANRNGEFLEIPAACRGKNRFDFPIPEGLEDREATYIWLLAILEEVGKSILLRRVNGNRVNVNTNRTELPNGIRFVFLITKTRTSE